MDLVGSPDCNVLGSEIAEKVLQDHFYQVAACKIGNHDSGHDDFELGREGDHSEFFVDFGDEFRRAGKCYAGNKQQAPVHAAVLADAFTEGSALVIDGEGGDLLDELEEIDGAVEKGWFELAFQIDF